MNTAWNDYRGKILVEGAGRIWSCPYAELYTMPRRHGGMEI